MWAPFNGGREAGLLVEVGVGGEANILAAGKVGGKGDELVEVSGTVHRG